MCKRVILHTMIGLMVKICLLSNDGCWLSALTLSDVVIVVEIVDKTFVRFIDIW